MVAPLSTVPARPQRPPPHVLLQMGPVSLFHPLKATLEQTQAGCAPRSSVCFPSAEELVPQQRWGSVSAAGRRRVGTERVGSPGSTCSPLLLRHPAGARGSLRQRSRTGSPRVLSPPTRTHCHQVALLWVQLVQAATRAGSVVGLEAHSYSNRQVLFRPRGAWVRQPGVPAVPPAVCSCFSVRWRLPSASSLAFVAFADH